MISKNHHTITITITITNINININININRILELTASEPLTLDEEYEMQKTWYNDPSKLTFIILAKHLNDDDNDINNNNDNNNNNNNKDNNAEINHMVGDVNLFLHDTDDKYNAEIEIMIADSNYRNKGFATESLNLIMFYGFNNLGIRRFFAKISETNTESIRLFEKLGYLRINYSEVWKEIEYEFLTNFNDDDDDEKKIMIKKNRNMVTRNVENAVWTSYDC